MKLVTINYLTLNETNFTKSISKEDFMPFAYSGATLYRHVQVETSESTLEHIATLWVNQELISYNKWLQRLQQEKKWKSRRGKKALEYLSSLMGTDGCVQGFLICGIDIVLDNLQLKKRQEPKLQKLWSEMIEWLENKKKNGAKYIILDGQNRLAFAIVPFLFKKMMANIKILSQDENQLPFVEELRDVTFDSLYDEENDCQSQLQKDILNIPVIIQRVVSGDIRAIRDQIISLNESEMMTQNEKRSTDFTAVSLSINTTVSHPTVVQFFKKLPKIFSGEKYDLEKKGDVRFLAEFLHYLRNGSCGSENQLDVLYATKDDDINKQIDFVNDVSLWIAMHMPKSLYGKLISKEIFRHVFQSIARLLDKGVNSKSLSYNIKKLNQIKKPSVLLSNLLNKLVELHAADENFEPRYKVDDKTGDFILDVDGEKILLPRRAKDSKTHSFYQYHTGATAVDLDEREKLFTKHFNVILEDCKKSGAILANNDARNITTVQMMQAQAQHKNDDLDRWPTKNLVSFNERVVHHMIPVGKGGENDSTNELVLTSSDLNTKQSDNYPPD